MAKQRTTYVCRECGYECAKWMGKCPSCYTFNTLEEVVEAKQKPLVAAVNITKLKDVKAETSLRFLTNIGEFDRVLGGGVVKGSVVLAGGEPGIGKSTLLLQAASELAKNSKVLYVS